MHGKGSTIQKGETPFHVPTLWRRLIRSVVRFCPSIWTIFVTETSPQAHLSKMQRLLIGWHSFTFKISRRKNHLAVTKVLVLQRVTPRLAFIRKSELHFSARCATKVASTAARTATPAVATARIFAPAATPVTAATPAPGSPELGAALESVSLHRVLTLNMRGISSHYGHGLRLRGTFSFRFS